MKTFFEIFPAVSYWITAGVWTVIVALMVMKLREAPKQNGSVSTLVIILSLDATRTLLESLYFGTYWSSIFGVFPAAWHVHLQNSVYVGTLKLVTTGTGLLVLVVLLRRWFPADEAARSAAARDLRDSQEATELAETRYRRIVETSLDVICTFDRKRCFRSVSPRCREVWGYAPEELIGRFFTDFVHPDDRETSISESDGILAGRATESFENRYIHRDGHVVHMMWSSVWSEEDQQFYCVARDVTRRHEQEIQRRELEERLNQSQRLEAVGQLTGGLAHDFNNLLTVIIGNSEIFLDKLPKNSELRRFADMNLTAARRGSDLTRRLLAFSRRQSLEPQNLDINLLVASTESLLERLIGDHVEMSMDLSPDPLMIHADPLQIESALVNLSVNARDAMPAGGRLNISTCRRIVVPDEPLSADLPPGEYAAVRVRDTGSGMAPEVVSRIFEPFFTTKDIGKGSGLGLSMVYGFVRQSGGHVHVESALGKGTTITLLFPRIFGAVESISEEHSAGAMRGGGELVLVVEDNDLVRAHTATLLGRLGYTSVEAADGREALELLKARDDIRLLFTDMMMPGGLNGLQLARAARQARPNLPVLITTGFAENDGSDNPLPKDFPVLRKPYHGNELALALRGALQGRL